MSLPGIGDVSAVLRPAGDIEWVQVGRSVARFVAPGAMTAGRYGLFRWDMKARAGGASAHVHRTYSEAFFVLSGTVHLFDGRAWVDATPGDFLFVPEGGIHGFRNDAREPASMLILFAPGAAREAYFEELSEIIATGRVLSPADWTELYARHDTYLVDR
jgi:mannose-6-phosphate isomerase-like protein (cupin superfamily)